MRTLTTLFLLALLATACGGGDAPIGGDDAADPTATPVGSWVLDPASLELELPDGARVTLTVEQADGGAQLTVGGVAACNQYFGEVTLDGGRWTGAGYGQTEMGCEQPLMDAEQRYLAALTAVMTWSRPDADVLVLTGGDEELRFGRLPAVEPAAFTGTTWVVDSYIAGAGDDAGVSSSAAGTEPATIRFDDDGTFTLFTGCRDFAGDWTTSGDTVVLPRFGQVDDSRGVTDTGEVDCDAAALAQEGDVLGVLESGGFTAEVDGRRLTLTSGAVGLGLRPDEDA